MKSRIIVIVLAIIFVIPLHTKNTKVISPNRELNRANIPFIENMGQVDSRVQYYAQTFAGTVYLTRQNEIVYALPDFSGSLTGIAIKEKFICGKNNGLKGEKLSETRISCYNRQNNDNWKTNIPSYKYVSLGEVFKNIEVKLSAYGDNVEKLFFVKSAGDPNDIKVELSGANGLSVNNKGELVIETALGNCTFTKPIAYQTVNGSKKNIEVVYKLHETGYGFSLGEYDKTKLLVIDPLLASTYVGGNRKDEEYEPAIVLDSNGFVFVTGETYSTNFPTTTGVYDNSFNGTSDRMVSKFSSDLTTLVASTFIGGSDRDCGMGICVDENNDIYLAGYTFSSDFPVTADAFDQSFNGGQDDMYLLKLNNDLTTLLASTYIGGNNVEGSQFPRVDLAVGNEGNIYLAGLTNSNNLPTNSSSYSQAYNGGQDVFVAKFSPDLSTLQAATYLGGNTAEWRPSIQIDNNGNVFISGTTSADYPTTAGAYCSTFAEGGYDMFVSKLSADLSQLLASTYLGSSGSDNLKGIRLDNEGNVYTAGLTTGSDFPTTAGAFDETYNDAGDMCISKLDNNLETLLASTFVGGTGADDGEDVYLDASGNVYVIGLSQSTNYPVTGNAYDQTYNGTSTGADAVVSVFTGDLSSLMYSTYFGSGLELGKCIVVDAEGAFYISGITYSSSYPTTNGCYDNTFNGSTDVFIAKFGSVTTGIQSPEVVISDYHLSNNYPNPFNPSTSVEYSIPRSGNVALSIYDIEGRLIKELVDGFQQAGDYSVSWNGKNSFGKEVAGGVYLYRIKSGNFSQSRKMLYLK